LMSKKFETGDPTRECECVDRELRDRLVDRGTRLVVLPAMHLCGWMMTNRRGPGDRRWFAQTDQACRRAHRRKGSAWKR